ncbi:MAG: NAD(P)-dependent oxidoreductase [Acidimicrobiia bacterium]|nr:NAD(P)-dependent oxidoreductase [Acidimicrobiia bacterium]
MERSTGRFEGKVVFITGAARGQGRSHARRFAAEGANVIAIDACAPILPDVAYEPATVEDLAETARLVEQEGRGIVTRVADVRDQSALDAAVAEGIDRFGRLDVIVANAGVASYHLTWEVPEEHWATVLDVNLTGVWRTVKAGLPAMIEAGNGGAITFISSAAGLRGYSYLGHYAATKHGLVGLMRSLTLEVGQYDIRVNTIHPGAVDTVMGNDPDVRRIIAEDPRTTAAYTGQRPLDGGAQKVEDISNALLWICSDEARMVTGVALPVDAGAAMR